MRFKNITFEEDKVAIKNIENFNIKQILECGQCFRWEKVKENNYIGVAYGRVIEVIQEDDTLIILNTNELDFKNIWYEYFDFDTDYYKIKDELSNDELLKRSIDYGYGIRILNQEPFEILISFIISARNSIPSISKTIKKISEAFGEPIEYKGTIYYTFPNKEQLKDITLDEIKETGASFRSKYIIDTIEKLNTGDINKEYDLKYIKSLEADECHIELQKFKGVGAKVADCVMLFSMKKTSAFPVDVWVKRAIMYFYNREEASLNKIRVFARDKFKDLSGYAQQYLFFYARENKIKIDD